MSKRTLCSAFIALALLQMAVGADAQSPPGVRDVLAPLVLDGATSLDVDPEPSLEFGEAGAIDFWVAALWESPEDVSPFPAILGQRVPYDGDDAAGYRAATRYSVHVDAYRETLGLFNGRDWGSVEVDLTDGRLHHVALVTRDDTTDVFFDGEYAGVIGVGYGEARGLPLHVGSSDGASEFFVGAIASLRLWNDALTPGELAEVREWIGVPATGEPFAAADKLAAYSTFTADAQVLTVLSAADLPPPPPTLSTRGRLENLKRKRQEKKQDKLEDKVEKTEASLQDAVRRQQAIQRRMGELESAPVVEGSEIRVQGLTFRHYRVDGEVVRDNVRDRALRGLRKQSGRLEREIADYTRTLDGGPPEYGRGASTGLYTRLRRTQEELGNAPTPKPVRRPRAQRPADYALDMPGAGADIATDAGRARVAQVFGAGANGGAFLIRRQGSPGPEVMKQGLDIEGNKQNALERYRRRRLEAGLADFEDEFGEAGPKGQPGLSSTQALLARQLQHEVEMQNLAAGDGTNPALFGARMLGRNRIRMNYGGEQLGRILQSDAVLNADHEVREAIIFNLVKQALTAANAMHARGVVHRDLNIGNLTLDENGQLKVIDFGMAKRIGVRDQEVEFDVGVGFGGPGNWGKVPQAAKSNPATFASDGTTDVYGISDTFYHAMKGLGLRETPRGDVPATPLLAYLNQGIRAPQGNPDATQLPANRPNAAQALATVNALTQPSAQAQAQAAGILQRLARDAVNRTQQAYANAAPAGPGIPQGLPPNFGAPE